MSLRNGLPHGAIHALEVINSDKELSVRSSVNVVVSTIEDSAIYCGLRIVDKVGGHVKTYRVSRDRPVRAGTFWERPWRVSAPNVARVRQAVGTW
jgi:hypothetical protein